MGTETLKFGKITDCFELTPNFQKMRKLALSGTSFGCFMDDNNCELDIHQDLLISAQDILTLGLYFE